MYFLQSRVMANQSCFVFFHGIQKNTAGSPSAVFSEFLFISGPLQQDNTSGIMSCIFCSKAHHRKRGSALPEGKPGRALHLENL
jgi:hypothetical protein